MKRINSISRKALFFNLFESKKKNKSIYLEGKIL